MSAPAQALRRVCTVRHSRRNSIPGGTSMISRRSLAASAMAIVAAAALAGTAAPAFAQEKKTVRVVMHAPLRITDPIITTAYVIRNHGYLIYDTLFAMDAEQKIQPQMVEKSE